MHPDSARPSLVQAIALVAFDADKGPVLESIVPSEENFALAASVVDVIAFAALPDSSTVGSGAEDAHFVFRVDITEHPSFVHTLFRQRPDSAAVRGSFQKSLVILSQVHCLGIFRTVLSAIARDAFTQGLPTLELAFRQISAWPSMNVQDAACNSIDFTAPLLAGEISVHFPRGFASSSTFAGASATFRNNRTSIDVHPGRVREIPLAPPRGLATAAPFHEVHLARALDVAVNYLPQIWETAMLGQSLLVLGATPSCAAGAVLALAAITHPLPMTWQVHPYVGVHSPLYATLSDKRNSENAMSEPCIVGATSAHVANTLNFAVTLVLPAPLNVAAPHGMPGMRGTGRTMVKRPRGISRATAEDNEEPHALRDLIRDSLTRPFLRAFERYLVPRMEGNDDDPFGRKPRLTPFDKSDFPTQRDLAAQGVAQLFKASALPRAKMRGFYKRFVKGPVFERWWKQARRNAECECKALHRARLVEACGKGAQIDSQSVKTKELKARVLTEIKECDEGDAALRMQLEAFLEDLSESTETCTS